ncbi:MAG: diacylglycerol kinase family lipid kinase [Flavobacteriaceae bacterium]|nr:diacylglycerol kinase family lipid kinase [Flavobacteriaceae bacterium]
MATSNRWFVIVNPTSGNGSSKRKWPKIKAELESNAFDFDFAFTEYANHSKELIQNAIKQGFIKIICVGGDGTLHNIINGVQSQKHVNPSTIQIGIIPIGTGNDWIKTHSIPLNIKNSISIIKNGNVKQQDLGKITFIDEQRDAIYFNNLAGVGFDGFVVSKVGAYKYLGALAYLIGAVVGLFSFKNFDATIILNDTRITTKSLMVLVGLCKYSGGGMRLTKTPNPYDGLFDVSIAKDLTKLEIIQNLPKLFNGKIIEHSKVETYKVNELSIIIDSEAKPFIQADGELIGTGNIDISIVPGAFSFYSN